MACNFAIRVICDERFSNSIPKLFVQVKFYANLSINISSTPNFLFFYYLFIYLYVCFGRHKICKRVDSRAFLIGGKTIEIILIGHNYFFTLKFMIKRLGTYRIRIFLYKGRWDLNTLWIVTILKTSVLN